MKLLLKNARIYDGTGAAATNKNRRRLFRGGFFFFIQ